MGGRVSILVLSGGETGGRGNSTEFIAMSWAEKTGRKKGGGGAWGEKELKAANVYGGFPVCQVHASQPRPVCAKD